MKLIGILVLVLTSQAAAQDKAKPTQAEAFAAIKKLGGKVKVDEKSPGKPVIIVFLNDTKVTDAGGKKLKAALPKCKISWTPPKMK